MDAPLAPMPPGHRLTGHLARRYRDPLGLFLDSQRLVGDVVRYRMATLPVHQFTHPDHVQQILVDPTDQFSKGEIWAKTRPLIGEGLVTSEGERWRQQRRGAQPAFHADRLAGLSAVLTDTIAESLDGWRHAADHSPVEVFAAARRLTLTMVFRALFGLQNGAHASQIERAGKAFPRALQVTNRRIVSPLPFLPSLYRVPTPGNHRFSRARRVLDDVVTEVIAERQRLVDQRRSAGNDGAAADLLGMLIDAFETHDTAADRRFLRDQVMTLLLAGFETTATTLTWALLLLADHPETARRTEDEVDRLDSRPPTAADLGRLVTLRAVVSETLRLYPPVYAIPRNARTECVIGGYRVPAGQMIIVVPYVTHRHPEFWDHPDTFDPDRFADHPTSHRYAYLPFGAGKRKCLGNNLAIMETVFALAMILQRYRLQRVGPPVEPDPYVTLRPRGEVPMLLLARS